ncbi:MAG: DUF368 domain-containing protein [Thiotrichales bacterium]|nr:DUF368 domain-containing protein [Thiotrichales bacterium]
MPDHRPTDHRVGGNAAAAKAGAHFGRPVPEFALKDAALGFARGFCMGAADVVPGVSGGTMAFILGIYRRFIEAIRAFDTALVRLLLAGRFRPAGAHADLAFIVPLGLGIFAALMFFARVVPLPRLIASHPELVYGLFFGLIVASVVVLFRSLGGVRAMEWIAVFVGATVGFGIVNLVPVSTPDAWWFVALSGALAISAMLLPGLSGAFILLILGKYAYVLDGIGRLDPGVLVPFGVGVVVGLIAFSRLLTWLLRECYRITRLAICGLLIGSLWVIWPFQARRFEVVHDERRLVSSDPVWPDTTDGATLGAFALMAIGIALVIVIQNLARRRGGPPRT